MKNNEILRFTQNDRVKDSQSGSATTTFWYGKPNSSLRSYSPLGESAELIGRFPEESRPKG
jgi:hypothetical protein